MNKKIFRLSFFTSLIVLIVSFTLVFGVLYEYLERQIFAELESEASYISYAIENEGLGYLKKLNFVCELITNKKIPNSQTWIRDDYLNRGTTLLARLILYLLWYKVASYLLLWYELRSDIQLLLHQPHLSSHTILVSILQTASSCMGWSLCKGLTQAYWFHHRFNY